VSGVVFFEEGGGFLPPSVTETGLPMKRTKVCKCLNCGELYIPDYRSRERQRYCVRPQCRTASKAISQKRWQAKPENGNYFRSPENTDRVKEWRKEHPGYWRRKKSPRGSTLQDDCSAQATGIQEVKPQNSPFALQEACLMQPAVLVGLISVLTGSTLQDDIGADTNGARIRRVRVILALFPWRGLVPYPSRIL
jgi:hypothetical protein